MSGADPRVRAVLTLAPVIPVFTPDDVDDAGLGSELGEGDGHAGFWDGLFGVDLDGDGSGFLRGVGCGRDAHCQKHCDT